MNNAFFFAIRIVLYHDYSFIFLDEFHHKNGSHRQDVASIMFWGSLYGNLDDEEDGTFIFTARMILHQWGMISQFSSMYEYSVHDCSFLCQK